MTIEEDESRSIFFAFFLKDIFGLELSRITFRLY